MLTAGAFGYQMALARVISAFLLGIAAGYLTELMINTSVMDKNKIVRKEETYKSENQAYGCKVKTLKGLFSIIIKMSIYISKYFFLALILSAVIKILAPAELMLRFFNSNRFLSVLFSAAAGVPFYVCGGAAIPVVQQLAEIDLSKGAVLAFFIAGPVTKLSNLLLVNTIYNLKILLLYSLIGFGGAVILGWFYNIL